MRLINISKDLIPNHSNIRLTTQQQDILLSNCSQFILGEYSPISKTLPQDARLYKLKARYRSLTPELQLFENTFFIKDLLKKSITVNPDNNIDNYWVFPTNGYSQLSLSGSLSTLCELYQQTRDLSLVADYQQHLFDMGTDPSQTLLYDIPCCYCVNKTDINYSNLITKLREAL